MFSTARIWALYLILGISIHANRLTHTTPNSIVQHGLRTSTGATLNVSTMFVPVYSGQRAFSAAFTNAVFSNLSGLPAFLSPGKNGVLVNCGSYTIAVAPTEPPRAVASASLMSDAPSLIYAGKKTGQGIDLSSPDAGGVVHSGYLIFSPTVAPLTSMGMELFLQNQSNASYPKNLFSQLTLTTGEVVSLPVAILTGPGDAPESYVDGDGYGFFAIESSTPFTEMVIGFEDEIDGTDGTNTDKDKRSELGTEPAPIFAGGTVGLYSLGLLVRAPGTTDEQKDCIKQNSPVYCAIADLPLSLQAEAVRQVLATECADGLWFSDRGVINATLNTISSILSNDTQESLNDTACQRGVRAWILPIGTHYDMTPINQASYGVWFGLDRAFSNRWCWGAIGAWQEATTALSNTSIKVRAGYLGGRFTASFSEKPMGTKFSQWVVFSKTSTSHGRAIPIFQAQANQAYASWAMYLISQLKGTIPLTNDIELKPYAMIAYVGNTKKSFEEEMTPLISGQAITTENAALLENLALKWDDQYSNFMRQEVGLTLKKTGQTKRWNAWVSGALGAHMALRDPPYRVGFLNGVTTFDLAIAEKNYLFYWAPMAGIQYTTSVGISIKIGARLQQSFVNASSDSKKTWSTWLMVEKSL